MIQEFISVPASELLETVSDIKTDGYRLGQICATTLDGKLEILYSFEKDCVLRNLRVETPAHGAELHSITAIYWPAFIYENEMHDLFGITFRNLALDFGGHFFKIANETPWNPQARELPPEAPEISDMPETAKTPETPEIPKAETREGGAE
jgi:ech hydrogenase subunit D